MYQMLASGESTQHGDRFGGVAGLAERRPVYVDDRIGCDDQLRSVSSRDGLRFRGCVQARQFARRISGAFSFVDVAGNDHNT